MTDERLYRFRVSLDPQPEGGFTVTSPDVPELVTEGDTVAEALANAREAFRAVLEIYEDEGRDVPREMRVSLNDRPIQVDDFVVTA